MKCDSDDRVFRLSKHDVNALVEFASSDKTRTSISCVRFEPEAGTAIATDGHALVAAKNCGTYKGEAFSVPLAPLVSMAKLLKKDDYLSVTSVRVAAEEYEIVVTAPNGAATKVKAVDDLYPAWRQVIPESFEGPPARTVGFNTVLLARLALVQKASGCPGGAFMIPEDVMAAMKVTFDGFETKWTAVVMPMRM